MRLRAHDDAFVAVSPATAYALLADVASYAGWWPGARSGTELALGRGTLRARPSGHREGTGLWLELPALDGSLEWYLAPHEDGTIVNAFLDVELGGGPRRAGRRLFRLRRSVRAALVGLKRSLEGP